MSTGGTLVAPVSLFTLNFSRLSSPSFAHPFSKSSITEENSLAIIHGILFLNS